MVWERKTRADGEMGRGEEDSRGGLGGRMVAFVGSSRTSTARRYARMMGWRSGSPGREAREREREREREHRGQGAWVDTVKGRRSVVE